MIIKKIEKNKSNLSIEWSDGEKSNFNYFWLRDNCPTAHDKDSNHRMFNILEVSKNLNVKDFKVNGDGKLAIEWSEGDHTSYYDPKWLRENCYTIKNKKKYSNVGTDGILGGGGVMKPSEAMTSGRFPI